MSSDLNRRLQRAIELAQAGKADEARPILKEVVLQNPRLPLAWMWLAAVATDESERINALQRVLALDPSNTRARQALEALGVVEGEFDEPLPPAASNAPISAQKPQQNPSQSWALNATEWTIIGIAVVVAIFLISSVFVYTEVINAPTETPTATTTFTPSATFTPPPTNTPLPTRTPLPTQPSLPPPVTPTPELAQPTNTPRPSFTPRPTSTPIRFFDPEDVQIFGG